MKATTKISQRILVVRNDKLGDFMLAFPSFRTLRETFPDATIVALVPSYTADIARQNPDIDTVIIDPGRKTGFASWCRLARELRSQRFDAVITLFSTLRVGAAVCIARIPYRLAPATKLAQLFYSQRLAQRRSRSEKPEYRYNLELVEKFCRDFARQPAEPGPPYLRFPAAELALINENLVSRFGIRTGEKIVIVHPGHGGSANNLTPDQYARLASELHSRSGHFVLVTAGPGESAIADSVAQRMKDTRCAVYHSTAGLVEFAKLLAVADLFIGGSTGPLHVAGALDTPTAAFYPRGRVTSALRWQTLNSEGRRLAFFPPAGSDENAMETIDLESAAPRISDAYLSS
jgi:ADP-heptose:LPS heptosyltransferase